MSRTFNRQISASPVENETFAQTPRSQDPTTGPSFPFPQSSMSFDSPPNFTGASSTRAKTSTQTWNFGKYHPLKLIRDRRPNRKRSGGYQLVKHGPGMNLAASFENTFFLAIDDRIEFFYTPQNEVLYEDGTAGNISEELRPYHSVQIPQDATEARSPLPESTTAINTIKVGALGVEPVLAAVDDQGLVAVWLLRAPKQKPMVFDNKASTWGLALNGPKRRIAVSANSHRITVYDLLTGSTRHLEGHDHNIPTIDFSPSGDRLASCSVDGTVRIWDLSSGACLAHRDVKDGFVWMCCFVNELRFLRVEGTIPDSAGCTVGAMSNPPSDSDGSDDIPLSEYSSDSPSLPYEASHVVSPTRFMQRSSTESTNSPSLTRSWPTYSSSAKEDLLIVTAASRAFLLSLDEESKSIREHFVAEHAVPDPRPGFVVRQFDRLNMMAYCPQLSLCIVASQKGLVALVRLVGGPGGSSIQLRREQTMPVLYDVPQVPLLGMFVVMDSSQGVPSSTRAWLYLIYYDGTMMRFLIETDPSVFPIATCIRI